MSQENVEMYRRSMDAWNRGALEEWLEDITPEWEFVPSGVFPGVSEVYRGRDGARRLWEDMRGPWDSQGFYFEVHRVEDLGDVVLGLSKIRARGKTSGAAAEREWAHVATYKDGVGIRTRNYPSWAEALEAVGLGE